MAGGGGDALSRGSDDSTASGWSSPVSTQERAEEAWTPATPDPPPASHAEEATPSPLLATPEEATPSPLRAPPAGERVRVFARVRPPRSAPCAVSVDGARSLTVEQPHRAAQFHFDAVFGPDAGQEECVRRSRPLLSPTLLTRTRSVYATAAAPLLLDVLDGFDVALLAYGQTGSGKTHTLLSGGEATAAEGAGLFPRLAADLFAAAAADFRCSYAVDFSACQVYQESVEDLLRPGGGPLRVRADEAGSAVVDGLSWLPCRSAAQLLEALRSARRRLVYAETVLNQHSSRSHCLLQLRVQRAERGAAAAAAEDAPHATTGRLVLADLAGSERVKKSGAEGARLREATSINGSLLALGNCVAALASRQRHVPFRDSLLTRLLESSLGGRSRTALIVCVSPESEHAGESCGACELAARAMRIPVAPQHCAEALSPAQLAALLGRGAEAGALAAHGAAILRLEAALHSAQAVSDAAAAEAAAARAAAEGLGARLAQAEAAAARGEAAAELLAAAAAAAEAQRREAEATAAAALAAHAAATEAAAREAARLRSEWQAEARARARAEAAAAAAAGETRDLAAALRAARAAAAAAEEAAAEAEADAAADGAADQAAWAEEAEAARARAEAAAGAEASALRAQLDAAQEACVRADARAEARVAAAAREAAAAALLSSPMPMRKTNRGGKSLWRLWRVAGQRLEWSGALGGAPWKGNNMQGGAELKAASLTLSLAGRPALVLHLDTPAQRAWAEALSGRLKAGGGGGRGAGDE